MKDKKIPIMVRIILSKNILVFKIKTKNINNFLQMQKITNKTIKNSFQNFILIKFKIKEIIVLSLQYRHQN